MWWILVDAWRVVLCLSTVLAAFLVGWRFGEPAFRMGGGVLELLGLLVVIWSLADTTKKFGRSGIRQGLRDWLAKNPFAKRTVRITLGTGAISVDSAGSVYGHHRIDERAAMVHKVDFLLRRYYEHVEQLKNLNEALRAEQKERQSSIESEAKARSEADERLKSDLREAVAGGVHLEWMGVVWILCGTSFGSFAPELGRWLGPPVMTAPRPTSAAHKVVTGAPSPGSILALPGTEPRAPVRSPTRAGAQSLLDRLTQQR
jgi:hypothetical protein